MAEYELNEIDQGLQLGTNRRHDVVTKEHILHVRIPVDPRKAEGWDDRFILVEDRAGEKFQQIKTPKDDLISGDRFVDLNYFNLKPDCSYSLIIDPGNDEPYYFFKDKKYGEFFS